ncbi:MAG: hypothetical protein KGJ75_12695 [Alphaproteobacteria bacterium]|nr:hypothetical protein [Alphaproteobacteria bacterium]MDE2075238.1 hypothetical protein [Alphaproteobacteria bacterium]MDE2351442.1 hypothetical protein [Alphaproteobacteria bacterium]
MATPACTTVPVTAIENHITSWARGTQRAKIAQMIATSSGMTTMLVLMLRSVSRSCSIDSRSSGLAWSRLANAARDNTTEHSPFLWCIV